MRVIVLDAFGDTSVLRLEERPTPTPGPNEVLLRVTSAGLNRADCLYREGKHYVRPKKFPARIGYEGAGIVEAVGPGSRWKVGDRLAGFPCGFDPITQGAFADYMVIPDNLALPTPTEVSDADAGAVWMPYITAAGALLEWAKLQPGQNIVINAASSSVGQAAVAVARDVGAQIIATTTHAHKAERIRQQGAHHVVCMGEGNYVDQVKAIVGSSNVHVFFDAVSGPHVNDHIRLGAIGSTILAYGLLDATPFTPHVGLMIGKGIQIKAFNIALLAQDQSCLPRLIPHIADKVNSRAYPLHIDRYFPLEEIVEAQHYLESNAQQGKIVITP